MREPSQEVVRALVEEALEDLNNSAGEVGTDIVFALNDDELDEFSSGVQNLTAMWWAQLPASLDEDFDELPYFYFVGDEAGDVMLSDFCLACCWQGESHSDWPYRAAISPPLPEGDEC